MSSAAHWLYETLRPSAPDLAARAFRAVHHVLLLCGLGAMVAATDAAVVAAHGAALAVVFDLALGLFAVEYVARLYAAAARPSAEPDHPWQARWAYARSVGGVIDLVAVLPFAVASPLGLSGAATNLFAVLWVLKLFRHSPGSGMLVRVLHDARQSLFSVFVAFVVIVLLGATLIHLFEGPAQPKLYGSILNSLWWTIVTLTTTGYGDFVPVTMLGRMLAAVVMICGIAMFALWAGILASAFANEVRRREFVRNWDLITQVPFFHDLGAATIADIARILKPQEVEKGRAIIRRGDPGDCMFFVVSGEIEVRLAAGPARLGPGGFFGEIALITGEPRSATAVAVETTKLLVLDIADFHDLTARRPELAEVVTQEGRRRMGARAPTAAQ